jgi:hypothetical protein
MCNPIAHRLRRGPRNFGGRRGTMQKPEQKWSREPGAARPSQAAWLLALLALTALTGAPAGSRLPAASLCRRFVEQS